MRSGWPIGSAIGEEHPHGRRADDGDALGASAVVAGLDEAARQQPRPQRLEKSSRHEVQAADDLIPGVALPWYAERLAVAAAAEGNAPAAAGGVDAGQPAQPVEQRRRERQATGVGVVACRWQGQVEREHALRLEAGIDRRHLGEAAQEKPGRGDQDDSERDFGNDERGQRPRTARGGYGPAAEAHRPRQRAAAGYQGRHQAKEQAGGERDGERESEHAQVQGERNPQRQELRRDAFQHCHSHPGNRDAEAAAERREREVLGQQLAHEPGAAGAERGANRQLLLTLAAAGQQQVGDVGAGNQQHE